MPSYFRGYILQILIVWHAQLRYIFTVMCSTPAPHSVCMLSYPYIQHDCEHILILLQTAMEVAQQAVDADVHVVGASSLAAGK